MPAKWVTSPFVWFIRAGRFQTDGETMCLSGLGFHIGAKGVWTVAAMRRGGPAPDFVATARAATLGPRFPDGASGEVILVGCTAKTTPGLASDHFIRQSGATIGPCAKSAALGERPAQQRAGFPQGRVRERPIRCTALDGPP